MCDYFEWLYMTSFYVTIVNQTTLRVGWQAGRQTDGQTGRPRYQDARAYKDIELSFIPSVSLCKDNALGIKIL